MVIRRVPPPQPPLRAAKSPRVRVIGGDASLTAPASEPCSLHAFLPALTSVTAVIDFFFADANREKLCCIVFQCSGS